MTKTFGEIVFSGQGFLVSLADRQVIFESTRNVWSTHTRFALERPVVMSDGHATGGTWKFVYLDATSGQLGLATLVKAYEWVIARFGGDFESYKNELSL